MIVCQPYHGAPISEASLDDHASIQHKLERAVRCTVDRSEWLPACERIKILRQLALRVEGASDEFALLIAREGGKPLTDARAEVTRAINGIERAAPEIERLAGKEIPMGLTSDSNARCASTIKEPFGVAVAISAFNHPLDLVVHQVIPAVATVFQ